MERRLGSRNVVLLGIGHTHAHLVKQWAMQPIPDVNLICVTDHLSATYSGMLPGVLAGDYSAAQMEIDLVSLLSVANVLWFQDSLVKVDREQRCLQFATGRQIRYDLLSLGVGSRPAPLEIRTGVAESIPVVSIKPMQNFLERLEQGVRIAQHQREQRGSSVAQVDVVGGGLGSVEVALCLRYFLQRCGWSRQDYQLRLISGSDSPPVGCLPRTRRRILKALKDEGIELLARTKLSAVEGRHLLLDAGDKLESDLVVYLAAGHASPVTQLFDLPKDDRGCILTNRSLQSIADSQIWAGGDCGTIQGLEIPKAGVFAVRQGPVMWDNLGRFVEGRPLQPYHPQSDFLKLINLGGGQAIGEWRGLSFRGRWVWRWKDHIDTNFMQMYQSLPDKLFSMMNDLATSKSAMRCLGCGSKIGAASLRQVLANLSADHGEDMPTVLAPTDTDDDVALIRCVPNSETTASTGSLNDKSSLAVSVDAFPAPVADPWLAGRLATIHALSDLWASGVAPQHVLATVEVPFGPVISQQDYLQQVMSGIQAELREHQVRLVGGHSLEGPRLSIALTVLGAVPGQKIPAPKRGLRSGDGLIMTKGIGTGVALAALMRGRCTADIYSPLVQAMLQPNRIALELLEKFSIHAMTDITGFGLLGHLREMVGDDRISVRLSLADIRQAAFPGVIGLIEAGWRSTMHENNLSFLAGVESESASARVDLNPAGSAAVGPTTVGSVPLGSPPIDSESLDAALLLDPQTCGGLLFSLPEQQAIACLAFLRERQFPAAAVIGHVSDRRDSWCVV